MENFFCIFSTYIRRYWFYFSLHCCSNAVAGAENKSMRFETSAISVQSSDRDSGVVPRVYHSTNSSKSSSVESSK